MKLKIKTFNTQSSKIPTSNPDFDLNFRIGKIVLQRNPADCGICSIAMALDKPYETILKNALKLNCFDPIEGMDEEEKLLNHYGKKVTYIDRLNIPKNIKDLERFLDNKKALVIVPLKSNPEIWHLTYWDGKNLFDPDPKNYYTNLKETKPLEIILIHD